VRRPRSAARAAVSPIEQTCGSVNTTCGTHASSASARMPGPSSGLPFARAAITSPAILAWYLPMWVSRFCPVMSPHAYSQPPRTCIASSTVTYFPGSRPTVSKPSASLVGVRPVATSSSSPTTSLPSSRTSVTSPAGRRASVAFRPVSTVIPASSKDERSSSDAAGSAFGSSRGAYSTIVTSSAPSPRIACAISQPTTPPPSTISRRGAFSAFVTSRLVHGCASRRPGTGGIVAMEPVANTTAWFAVSVRVSPSGVVTSTVLGPASRPWPRTNATPAPSSQASCPASSCPNGLLGSAPTNQSRRLNTALASSDPVTASLTPGITRVWSYSSTGRSRALLGMHA
jgi:hypothetical protein